MACSVCRKAGHTKRNCPKIEEEKKENIRIMRNRLNVFIQSPAFNTFSTAISFAVMSQYLQKQGFWENIAGETIDIGILGSGALGMTDPALVLGALLSQAWEHGDSSAYNFIVDYFKMTPNVAPDDAGGTGGVRVVDPDTGEVIVIIPPLTGNGSII
jgi:hypothetical protein